MIKFSFVLAILACVSVQVNSHRRNWRTRTTTTTRAPAAVPADCKTVTGQRCKFPFIYKGETYNECTFNESYNGNPWCAYETKYNDNAVPNKWEDCDKKACNICVTESGPDAGNPCKFPFKYNGETYNSCAKYTWSGRDYGKSWCSTETDRNGNHVNGKGKYGFCGSSCSGYKPTTPTTPTPTTPRNRRNSKKECYTIGGPVRNAQCKFPYRYKGYTYTSCTKFTSTSVNYGKSWCATNTDSYGNYIKGNYGICGTGNGCF